MPRSAPMPRSPPRTSTSCCVVQVTFTDAAVVHRDRRQACGAAGAVDVSRGAHRRPPAPQFVLRREPRPAHAQPPRQGAGERPRRARQRRRARRDPDTAARAAAIVRDLARAKILVVGDHPTGFDACNYNADEMRERFGVESVTTPVSAFLDSVKALPDSVADAPYARRAARLQEPGRDGPGGDAQDAEGVFGAQGSRREAKGSTASPFAAGPNSSPSTAAPPAARSR